MPRRRPRKTNWKPQEERRLRIRSVRRGTPDSRKLSRAFIALALARAEAEAEARTQANAARDTHQPNTTDRTPDHPRGDRPNGAA